jgi:hypothetical protein
MLDNVGFVSAIIRLIDHCSLKRAMAIRTANDMAMQPSAPCPHCKAENLSHRRECWRCKRTLPTSFALDAHMQSSRKQDANHYANMRPTVEDIESAVAQAVIVGDEAQAPEEAGGLRQRLVWILRKRTRIA